MIHSASCCPSTARGNSFTSAFSCPCTSSKIAFV
jgi:hypothetical protein